LPLAALRADAEGSDAHTAKRRAYEANTYDVVTMVSVDRRYANTLARAFRA
jgi:hypothetical protein